MSTEYQGIPPQSGRPLKNTLPREMKGCLRCGGTMLAVTGSDLLKCLSCSWCLSRGRYTLLRVAGLDCRQSPQYLESRAAYLDHGNFMPQQP